MLFRKCNLGLWKVIMVGRNSTKCCYPYGNSFFCTLPFFPCESESNNIAKVSKNGSEVHLGPRKCRAMIGPHWMGVVMTIGVILGGTIMNLRIIKHSQPISPFKLLALHTFIAVFCVITILLLLLTATTDPGIVLPNLDEYDTEVQAQSKLVGKSPNSNTHSGLNTHPSMRASQRRSFSTSNSDGDADDIEDMSESLSDEDEDEDEDGDDTWDARGRGPDEEAAQLVDRPLPRQAAFNPPTGKSNAPPLLFPSFASPTASSPGAKWDYCAICSVIQDSSRKIRHCADCGYCIEGHDHHCPWMGQCVGKKNMRWFILFNASWIIYFIEFVTVAAVLKSREG